MTNSNAICWINQTIKPAFEATVSVFDHGLLYGDGIFEGPSGGSFDMDFSSVPEPYVGGLTIIEIADWFDTAFTDPDALAVATVIPEPITLSLLAFGGLALLRRRR